MKSLFISKKGYTLIELLVVIGILAVLAAIAIPSVAGLIQKSQATVDNKNAREMTNALERFASEYELYKEDLSMNHVDLSRMDAMQGRVYSVVKTTNRSDFSKFEIGETDENLAYDNFYINKKTNYPLTEIGARRVLTSYLKTKVANFTPLRSGYSFYYSPECGQVVCAKTGSTYEEIEAVAAVSGPYVSMSSSLVTRTSWSFEPNQIGVNQWINLTVNDGKDMMNFNFANVATETLTDYTYLRGFHQYNDTLEKELFYNGRDYHFAIDENTNDKYLNVLVFVFDKENNGTVYDHKLEIFDSQNPVDLEVVKDYCRIWAGNWDEYSSGEKAVQMDPNDIDGDIEQIFSNKPNPEHALTHDFLESGRYCTLYKTPVEVNKASFKYEVKSEDTIILFDFKQASSNTSDAHTFDEMVYRYYKTITNDGIDTLNMLFSQGYCDGNSGYFVGWGPGAYGYVREKTSAPPMYFYDSIPDNQIHDGRWELPDDEEDNPTPEEINWINYPNIELVETKTVGGTTIYTIQSADVHTKYQSPRVPLYTEYSGYSEFTSYHNKHYLFAESGLSNISTISTEISDFVNKNAIEYGRAYIYYCTDKPLTNERLSLFNDLCNGYYVDVCGSLPMCYLQLPEQVFNMNSPQTRPLSSWTTEQKQFINTAVNQGGLGYLNKNGVLSRVDLGKPRVQVGFEGSNLTLDEKFEVLYAIKNNLTGSNIYDGSNFYNGFHVVKEGNSINIEYINTLVSEAEIKNIISDIANSLSGYDKVYASYYADEYDDKFDDNCTGFVISHCYENGRFVSVAKGTVIYGSHHPSDSSSYSFTVIVGNPINPDEYSFNIDEIDHDALWDELMGG